MELKVIKYEDVKERLEELNDDAIEKIKMMDSPLSKENANYLVKLITGQDVDSNKISGNEISNLLIDLEKSLDFDGQEELKDIVSNMREKVLLTHTTSIFQMDNVENVFTTTIEAEYKLRYEKPELEDAGHEDDLDNDFEIVPDGDFEQIDEKNNEILEVKYEDLVEHLKRFRERNVENLIKYQNEVNSGEREFDDYDYEDIISYFLFKEGMNIKPAIEPAKIDSRDLTKFIKKVKDDFEQVLMQKKSELEQLRAEQEETEKENDLIDFEAIDKESDLEEEIKFHEKWYNILNTAHTNLKQYKGNKLKKSQPKYNLDYKPSQAKRKPKFHIEGIDTKKYLGALKNIGTFIKKNAKSLAWGAGGVAAGLTLSATLPLVPILASFGGVVTFASHARLVYVGCKLFNSAVRVFSPGGETTVDLLINDVKEKIKKSEIKKKKYNVETGEMEVVSVKKVTDTKLYGLAKGANDILKNPSVQWFINGISLGYTIGNILDLDGKLQNVIENRRALEGATNATEVVTEAPEYQTGPTEPSTTEPTVSQNDIPTESKPINGTNKPSVQTQTPTTEDYSWLDVGKDGDKLDLSGMEKGYTDSYAARGAYTGEYAHLNKSVDLATKYATEANGTFISELRLPDGSVFTGNVGELLESGVDPSQIAANICNANGDYAWGNLEEVLKSIPKRR